ncbi:DeoR/GlpR family DNA-binding transcription regulator [Enterococcus sp. AZ196]|uniref:DeoR/GlpR family DNA-binding transcription regulator n=1 Tax=Enterococcus sp. AZ196 TaxID=2774659 RepID=UPI003D282D83
MASKDRISLIKQLLINEKKVSVASLSEQFSVTEETIRRDLDKLEAEGILTRTYGGAVLNSEETVSNIPFYKRAEHNVEAKQAIAFKVREVLESVHTIAADASSTVMETLKLLKDREDMTIVTNSSEALRELMVSEVNVLSTGGILNKRTLSMQGDLTERAIENYNVEMAVISCKGIDKQVGATDTNEVEARIKKIMIAQASEVMLLIDSEKFCKKGFVHLSNIDQINHVVTDKKPSDDWIDFFTKNNIQLHY